MYSAYAAYAYMFFSVCCQKNLNRTLDGRFCCASDHRISGPSNQKSDRTMWKFYGGKLTNKQRVLAVPSILQLAAVAGCANTENWNFCLKFKCFVQKHCLSLVCMKLQLLQKSCESVQF